MAIGPKTCILWMFVIWKAYIPWMSFHDKTSPLQPPSPNIITRRQPPPCSSCSSCCCCFMLFLLLLCHLRRLVLPLFLILIVTAVTFVQYSTNAKFSRAPGLGARPKRMWYYIVCSRLHTRPYLVHMWCGGKPGLTTYICLSNCLFQAAQQTISP